jgi:hypothetical protein
MVLKEENEISSLVCALFRTATHWWITLTGLQHDCHLNCKPLYHLHISYQRITFQFHSFCYSPFAEQLPTNQATNSEKWEMKRKVTLKWQE